MSLEKYELVGKFMVEGELDNLYEGYDRIIKEGLRANEAGYQPRYLN